MPKAYQRVLALLLFVTATALVTYIVLTETVLSGPEGVAISLHHASCGARGYEEAIGIGRDDEATRTVHWAHQLPPRSARTRPAGAD